MTLRKFILSGALALMAATLYAAQPKVLTFTLQPQMTCSNCENKIKSNLRFEKGVKVIKTSIASQHVDITYDPEKTDTLSLIKAFGKIGYKARVVVKKEDGNKNKK